MRIRSPYLRCPVKFGVDKPQNISNVFTCALCSCLSCRGQRCPRCRARVWSMWRPQLDRYAEILPADASHSHLTYDRRDGVCIRLYLPVLRECPCTLLPFIIADRSTSNHRMSAYNLAFQLRVHSSPASYYSQCVPGAGSTAAPSTTKASTTKASTTTKAPSTTAQPSNTAAPPAGITTKLPSSAVSSALQPLARCQCFVAGLHRTAHRQCHKGLIRREDGQVRPKGQQ